MVASMCSSLATLAWNLAVAFRAVAGRMLYTCSTPALLPCSSPCIPRLAWLQEGPRAQHAPSEQLKTARLWLRLLRLGSPRVASRPPPPLTLKAATLLRSDQAGGEEVPFVSVDGCVPHLEVCGPVVRRALTRSYLYLPDSGPYTSVALAPNLTRVLDPDPDSDPIALALALVLTLALWALAIGVAAVRRHDQRRSRAARAADLHRRGASRRAAVDGPALQHLPAIRCSTSRRAARS